MDDDGDHGNDPDRSVAKATKCIPDLLSPESSESYVSCVDMNHCSLRLTIRVCRMLRVDNDVEIADEPQVFHVSTFYFLSQ